MCTLLPPWPSAMQPRPKLRRFAYAAAAACADSLALPDDRRRGPCAIKAPRQGPSWRARHVLLNASQGQLLRKTPPAEGRATYRCSPTRGSWRAAGTVGNRPSAVQAWNSMKKMGIGLVWPDGPVTYMRPMTAPGAITRTSSRMESTFTSMLSLRAAWARRGHAYTYAHVCAWDATALDWASAHGA